MMILINGPLLDRIDSQLDVVRVPFQKLAGLEAGESSAVIRQRSDAARQVQMERFSVGRMQMCS
jgi:magnesium chelatase family protein